jgi:predicted small secreted protein
MSLTKWLAMLLVTVSIWGCNTAGGLIKGAGKDLQAVGEWIEPNPRERHR